MTPIAILPQPASDGGLTFRAVSGEMQSSGKTLGEALDLLTHQIPGAGNGVVVLVNTFAPDRFFSASQQQRLAELMQLWRVARDAGQELPSDQRSELETLVEQELEASAERTAAFVRELRS